MGNLGWQGITPLYTESRTYTTNQPINTLQLKSQMKLHEHCGTQVTSWLCQYSQVIKEAYDTGVGAFCVALEICLPTF